MVTPELKDTISEMKNSLDSFNDRFKQVEEALVT